MLSVSGDRNVSSATLSRRKLSVAMAMDLSLSTASDDSLVYPCKKGECIRLN